MKHMHCYYKYELLTLIKASNTKILLSDTKYFARQLKKKTNEERFTKQNSKTIFRNTEYSSTFCDLFESEMCHCV